MRNTFSRIDYIFLSHHALERNAQTYIGPSVWSDHSPVFLPLELPGLHGREWSWRLNDGLLKDSVCSGMIKEAINNFFADHEADTTPQPYQWEARKCVLRGIFIQQGTRLKKDRASTIRATQESLQALEQEHKQTPSEASLLRVSEARSKLNDLYGKGYLRFRAKGRAASYELGNKCGRLVARALHLRQASTYIFGIKGKDDKMVHHPTHTTETFFAHFTQTCITLRDITQILHLTS